MSYTLTALSPRDERMQAQMDDLLRRSGIRRDRNLDYSCGVLDEEWNLIATGSSFRNTLRCFAVSREHQGEGLLNQVISHLMELQAERGNTHVFLYTKPGSAEQFGDLGFSEILRVEGSLVFMENRRRGFESYLEKLSRFRREEPSAAVVMNANPFTLGHRRLAETAAAEFPAVHLFVLSEEAGPIPFSVRRRLVREGTADLSGVMLHDSGPYIISAATFPSYFLRDEDEAIRAHAELDLTVFRRIAEVLGVACRFVGEEPSSHVTSLYNETMARRLPEYGLRCRVIPRLEQGGRPISAGAVRQAIHDGKMEDAAELVPETTLRYFLSEEARPVIEAIRAERDVIHY